MKSFPFHLIGNSVGSIGHNSHIGPCLRQFQATLSHALDFASSIFSRRGGAQRRGGYLRWYHLRTRGEIDDFAVGQLISASASYQAPTKTVTITWLPNETTGPQFSYRIEIFNNAGFTGNPLITRTDIAPHVRSQAINVSSLRKHRTYYVRVRITDILDRNSNYATTSFYRS